jgi:hypothetical protein
LDPNIDRVMSDPMAAGCGEMVPNDCTMDVEFISIDPDTRNKYGVQYPEMHL